MICANIHTLFAMSLRETQYLSLSATLESSADQVSTSLTTNRFIWLSRMSYSRPLNSSTCSVLEGTVKHGVAIEAHARCYG